MVLDAFGAAGGRGQENGGDFRLGRRHPPGAGLLRGQVRNDEAVHTVGRGLGGGALQPVLQHGVVVAHEDQRDLGLGAQFPRQVQDVLQVDAALHGPEAGGLNGGAVGQGIGKRHAQFQDIGAPGGHLQGQGPGGGQIRVTRSDKGDEGLFALGLELFEHPVNAAHRTPP